ncbi:MAG: hypothetical protein ACOC4L_02965 [Halanaerobium sp.]
MEKAVIDAIEYIDTAVDKTDQFDEYSPEMSEKVLDNRIMTLEGYIRYIERETMPKLENLIELLEVENNG